MLPQGIRLGDRYLTAFNVSTNEDWVWGAVAYLAVAYILLSMLSAFIVEKVCKLRSVTVPCVFVCVDVSVRMFTMVAPLTLSPTPCCSYTTTHASARPGPASWI